MYQRGYENNFKDMGICERARVVVTQNLPPPEDDAQAAQEVLSFRFIASTLIWLDTIFSVTAGQATQLNLFLCHHAYPCSSQLEIRGLTGCDTKSMLNITRISALYSKGVEMIAQGNLDCSEIQPDVEEISIDIIRAQQNRITDNEEHDLITRMFVYMAAVYIQLVTYGFQQTENLSETVSSSVAMLRTNIPQDLLPTIIAPIFIIGTAAWAGDEETFRQLLSTPPLTNPFFRHRARILPTLEEIWRRRSSPDFSWSDCIKLTDGLLLI
jgi:C6 transcription factor Pro1